MELIVNPQPLMGTHIHHPSFHGPATILYPGKDSPWQPVVTTLPSLPLEVPKETIIAHTDFTTTSLIAKRRLSSKKRKKQQESTGEATPADLSTPMDSSPDDSSPAGTSIPLGLDERRQEIGRTLRDALQPRPHPCSHAHGVAPIQPSSLATSCSDVGHQHVHTHHVAPGSNGGATMAVGLRPLPLGGGGQYVSVGPVSHTQGHVVATATSSSGGYSVAPTAEGLGQKQFADPVLNHLQQELNIRFLQEQSGLAMHPAAFTSGQVPHPQPMAQSVQISRVPPVSRSVAGGSSSSDCGTNFSGFRWCRAHVIIARQIQQHQQQTKTAAAVSQHQHSKEFTTTGPHPHHLNRHTPPQQDSMAQMAVAQQLALLQMYGVQPGGALPAGSYMTAVPYSLPEVQLRMQSYAPTVPGMPSQLSAVDSNLNLNSVPMMNSQHLQAPFAQSVPIATLAPSDLSSAAVMQGVPEVWGAPVPVIGSCIINPFPPGMMATSWVK